METEADPTWPCEAKPETVMIACPTTATEPTTLVEEVPVTRTVTADPPRGTADIDVAERGLTPSI
jgi:hypothetical protein